jgi:hypothetical protein
MCDGDRYDDRVTEIVDVAFECGYTLAFRQRSGGWEAGWRHARADVALPTAQPVIGATRTEAAERALAAIQTAAAQAA